MCQRKSQFQDELNKNASSKDKIFVDLLEKWKNKSTIIPCVAIHHALKKKGMKQQPPTVIVNLSLEFDYNAQTFLLAEEPSAVPLCLLPQLYQDNVSKTYQELRENACKKGLSSNQRFIQFVLISCEDIQMPYSSVKPLVLAVHEELFDKDIQAMRTMCSEYHLKSELFHGWQDIRGKNLEKQVSHLKTTQSHANFVSNALHLSTKEPIHLTHGIMFHLKMGKEIGQIAEFVKYEIKSIDEIIKDLTEVIKSKKDRQEVIMNQMDVHNSPNLLEARKKNPKTILAVTVYVDTDTKSMFYTDSGICDVSEIDVVGNLFVECCKTSADNFFKELQELVKRLPTDFVKSVSL